MEAITENSDSLASLFNESCFDPLAEVLLPDADCWTALLSGGFEEPCQQIIKREPDVTMKVHHQRITAVTKVQQQQQQQQPRGTAVKRKKCSDVESSDSEKDSKKQRRQIRNRLSAQAHRERKAAHLNQLETQLKDSELLVSTLKARAEQLLAETVALKQQLRQRDFMGGACVGCSDGYSSSSSTATESSPSPPSSPPAESD
jgi:hypothetical protein